MNEGSLLELDMDVQVVILAAGMGTRLGSPSPKPLTRLQDGRTILSQQMENIRAAFGPNGQVLVVVGFKLEQILEAVPDVAFAYNELYDRTNTSKSLLKALRATGTRGVLWMNGDVVFDPALLPQLVPHIQAQRSFVCVDTAAVGDEEVKYTVDAEGNIAQLSKSVGPALGEAIGINFVAAMDKAALVARLEEVDGQDYFERAIELAIARDGIRFWPVDLGDLFAVEVDFVEDLERANSCLS